MAAQLATSQGRFRWAQAGVVRNILESLALRRLQQDGHETASPQALCSRGKLSERGDVCCMEDCMVCAGLECNGPCCGGPIHKAGHFCAHALDVQCIMPRVVDKTCS